MSLLGLGCHRDAPHKRTQKDARPLLFSLHAGAPMPGAWSLEAHEAPIEDQNGYAGCTGHGESQLLWTTAHALGSPLPFVPSPAHIYRIVRCLGRPVPTVALEDNGGMPADIQTAISKWGIRPMGPIAPGRVSDLVDGNLNTEPTLGELEEAAGHIVVPEYRIDELASDVVVQVKQSIVAGFAVGVSFFADTAFMQFTAGASAIGAPNVSDPNGGGHWSVLTSFRTLADGSTIFRGPNSWGLTYGDRGHHEVTEAWLRACWDLYTGPVRFA